MHVFRHARGVAADIQVRAAFQPVVQRLAVFAQLVLDVYFVRLIARKREVEALQCAALQRLLPFQLIEKIAARVRVAEQQPVAAAGIDRTAFLHKTAERCDAGARADHDDVARGVGGQPEAFVAFDEYRQRHAFFAGGEKMRGRTPALCVAVLVLDMRDSEVRFIADSLAAGGDGIEPRLQWTQRFDQRLGSPCAGICLQQIDDLRRCHQCGQAIALIGREQTVQGIAAGVRRMRGDEWPAEAGDLALASEPFA